MQAYTSAASHYEYVAESPAQAKQKALECMNQCTGWCSLEKGAILVDLVLKYQPDVIVEVGVWGGRSFIPMAYGLKANGHGIAYGIDPWDNWASTEWMIDETNRDFWTRADHNWVLNDLLAKIEQFQLQEQIRLIKSTSENAPPIYDIDLLHIDGNHSDYTSYLDAIKWVPLVKSGGWIIFDDIHWHEKGVCTTQRAVTWLDEHCIRIAEFTEQNDWAIWVKP